MVMGSFWGPNTNRIWRTIKTIISRKSPKSYLFNRPRGRGALFSLALVINDTPHLNYGLPLGGRGGCKTVIQSCNSAHVTPQGRLPRPLKERPAPSESTISERLILYTNWQHILRSWTHCDSCDTVFRILELLEALRQSFQSL